MRRVMVTLVLVLVPALASAQEADRLATGLRPAAERALAAAVAPGNPVDAAGVGQQPAKPLPPPALPEPQRRGSMVGYIDDAVVGSKIRVRFETGFHNHVPDRAEFFYAKCGCYRDLTNSLKDLDAPGPGPGIVTDLNFQQFYIQAEYSPSGRVSVFGELPSRWIQPQTFAAGTGSFPKQSGFGDARLGVKAALLSQPNQVATLQVQFSLPSGTSENGLGTHHTSIEPALLLYNGVTDRVVIESQIGWWHPIGGSLGLPTGLSSSMNHDFSGDVFFYGIGPSFEVYQNRGVRFAPIVELVGWNVRGGSQTVVTGSGDATGTNIVNLKVGGRIAWNSQNSVYAGWGKALTSASWYDDIFRIEYRYSF